MHTEVDGNEVDAVAICGFSIKFPQEATSADTFWEMMVNRRSAMTEFPADRINPSGFQPSSGKKGNTFPAKCGHFIKEDVSVFDADFFNISPAEATAMDPMQRWLLEAAYLSLENAGMSMESVSGSSTGVYTGCFTNDYLIQLYRDPECTPAYMATGVGASMLANRISWFFDLRGPSMAIDSACSSAATALDLACQGLKTGSCNLSLVAGCNLTFAPEFYQSMSNMNFLSPDGLCYSFDQRANGYSRGEGIAVVVLKRLSDAIRDGNTIRAVIRSTGCNEDGRTTGGITQPSGLAQERLIRETYRKAALSMAHTRYFEAHGTGTPIGDPIEATAVGKAFKGFRSTSDPLYMGAVKSNIGHLEGASALAGVIKAVLVLEKGIIPPNANFEHLNPKIDDKRLCLKFPEECYDWPTPGLRRASINSFGYGGSNAHIILDDAYNYMRLRGLHGRHCTNIIPGSCLSLRSLSPTPIDCFEHIEPWASPGDSGRNTPFSSSSESSWSLACSQAIRSTHLGPKLLVWSSGDEDGIGRLAKAYVDYFSTVGKQRLEDIYFLDDMAYTLSNCRSHLTWRSFAILEPSFPPRSLRSYISQPLQARTTSAARLGFVFTGQGAQWFAMGRELLQYSSFRMDLEAADLYLERMGCSWSVCEEISKSRECSNIDEPEISQALCTILQVALVNLLRSVDIRPSVVVGHSSGEIASAYAAGILSAESAYKLAYLRGLCSAELIAQSHNSSGPVVRGAMLSVALGKEETQDYLHKVDQVRTSLELTVACENSPRSTTIAGEVSLIDRLKALLDEKQVFARKLRVPVAYHSSQMDICAAKYETMIGKLSGPASYDNPKRIKMVSSVTGQCVEAHELLNPSYWSRNMVAPVQFSLALSSLCGNDAHGRTGLIPVVEHLIELGPHSALQGPIKEILRSCGQEKCIEYSSVLKRGQPAHITLLQMLGGLFCRGLAVNLTKVNEHAMAPTTGSNRSGPSLLVDLPSYPFNHSRSYWHESRISRNFRLRNQPPSDLLGVRANNWSFAEPKWRHFIKTSELPWSLDHVIDGNILYPAAGMLVMAIEAIKQLTEGLESVEGYYLHDVDLVSAIDLTINKGCVEVETTLHTRSDQTGVHCYDFTIRSYSSLKNDWILNCRGIVAAEISPSSDEWSRQATQAHRRGLAGPFLDTLLSEAVTEVDAQHMYAFLKEIGLDFGPSFQAARRQRYSDSRKQSSADIAFSELLGTRSAIPPVSLDAIFHLSLTALTSGGIRRIAAAVPTRIETLWLSSKANIRYSEEDTITACAEIKNVSSHGFTCRGIALERSDQNVVVWYDGLSMTNVTRSPTSQLPHGDSPQAYMRMQCKPALITLDPESLNAFLEHLHPTTPEDHGLWERIGTLVESTLVDLLKYVDANPHHLEREDSKPWKRYYLHWARNHIATRRQRTSQGYVESKMAESKACGQEITAPLCDTNCTTTLITTVAHHLQGLFNDDTSPLEVLLQSGLLKDYYEELNTHSTTAQIATYIDLLAHQHPGLNILEVGGGTGGGTRNFLRTLRSTDYSENNARSARPMRCEQYHFTDISPTLVDSARAEFGDQYPQMDFEILDIERDFSDQGFLDETYDLIIAVQVLHITSNLKDTLRRTRKSLKTGGKLILQEALNPSGGILSFIFGLFPGWWLGTEDGRTLAPSIGLETWDALLKEVGFSGVELVRQFGENTDYHVGWIVSTAMDIGLARSPSTIAPTARIVACDTNPGKASTLLEGLTTSLSQALGLSPIILPTITAATVQKEMTSNGLVILLLDPQDSPLLDATRWQQVQDLVITNGRVLFVSFGGGRLGNPSYGIVDGFLRTLRHEQPSRHLVSIALDKSESESANISHLSKIVELMNSRVEGAQYEQEFIVLDGLLHTRRLVDASDVGLKIHAHLGCHEVVSVPCDGSVRFGLAVEPSHTIPTQVLQFVQVEQSQPRLQENEVEILVRGLILKSYDKAILGRYCSGIVQSVGPRTGFKRDDRVFTVTRPPVNTCSHVVAPSQAVVRIPDHLSFEAACFKMETLLVAFHAACELGQVQFGALVLVQNGATDFGRAVLQVLGEHGIPAENMWATASNEREMKSILTTIDLPPDHIIPTTWLENSAILSPQWKAKFDLLILSEMPNTANILASAKIHGHVIVVDYVPRARSKSCVQLAHLATLPNLSLSVISPEQLIPTAKALNYAAGRCQDTESGQTENCKLFQASSITEALEASKTAAEHENVVVAFDEATIDMRRSRASLKDPPLNSEATYIIAGGLGGLGRAVSQWMVGHGARYLILMSRSGPKTAKAKELLSQLRKQGAHVETPLCDISNEASVRDVIASCHGRLPPIAGCIQATMVLKECFFAELQFEDWDSAVAPKVKGSWNLHSYLPSGLDFFVLFSSIMGIIGTKKLAGYNAGNTYQAALARYRQSLGEHAVCVYLGGVSDQGYVAENSQLREVIFRRNKHILPVSMDEVYTLLETCCLPTKSKRSSQAVQDPEVVIGLNPPAYWKHAVDMVPFTMRQPLWGHLNHLPLLGSPDSLDVPHNAREQGMSNRERALNLVRKLSPTSNSSESNLDEMAAIVSDALEEQIAEILGTTGKRIGPEASLNACGIDSLSAIDLRDWVRRSFGVEMSVFEILEGATLQSAGLSIVQKLQLSLTVKS